MLRWDAFWKPKMRLRPTPLGELTALPGTSNWIFLRAWEGKGRETKGREWEGRGKGGASGVPPPRQMSWLRLWSIIVKIVRISLQSIKNSAPPPDIRVSLSAVVKTVTPVPRSLVRRLISDPRLHLHIHTSLTLSTYQRETTISDAIGLSVPLQLTYLMPIPETTHPAPRNKLIVYHW